MSHRINSGSAPFDNYAAGLEEYEGQTPEDAATTEIAVKNAVLTIGQLMREDRKRREREDLPEIVLPEEFIEYQPPRTQKRRGHRRTERARDVLARLRTWRPGWVHAFWAAAFLAVLLWPRAVLLALFVGFVMSLVGVALFGPEMLERLRDRIVRTVLRRDKVDPETDAGEHPDARPDPLERQLHDLRG